MCECINNAIRHADASRIRVRLTRRGQDLEVEVGDDGRGGADASRGTGLRGLAGRVAAVDGELELRSPEGGGTTSTDSGNRAADIDIATDPAADHQMELRTGHGRIAVGYAAP